MPMEPVSLIATIVFLLAVIFIVDVMVPLGIAISAFYMLPVFVTHWLRRPKWTILTGAVSTVLILIGFFLSTEGLNPKIAVFNRVSIITALWMAVGIVCKLDHWIQERINQQKAIAQFGRAAMSMRRLEDLMQEANNILANYFKVQYSKILSIISEEEKVLLISGHGWESGLIDHWSESTKGDTFAAYTLRTAKPVVVRNLKKERRFIPPPLLLQHGIISCINVLIPGINGPFGILEADTKKRRYFEEDDVYFVQSLANLLGDAIRRLAVEGELTKKSDALSHSNRELEEFASIASHDLQEPLRKIMTFSDRLGQHAINDEVREYVQKMQTAATRMKNLINDLLLFSRLKTVKSQKLELIDLNGLLKEVMSDLELRISEKNAIIEIKPMPSILGNYFQIHQLFLNLISNALKYCCQNGQPPRVLIECHAAKHGFVKISVQDNGIGFDEKHLNQIFEPFKRLHGKGEFEGTGMGLAICKKIVDYHGGEITATSKPGNGTTFFVTLPVSK
jgi:signal transduction histidine kinase